MNMRASQSGFTLIEMLVTLGIVMLLASIMAVTMRSLDRQNDRRRITEMLILVDAALQVYYQSNGDFPAEDPNSFWFASLYRHPESRSILEKIDPLRKDRNQDLIYSPDVNGPVSDRGIVLESGSLMLRDLWMTPLSYQFDPGDTFPRIESAGPDRRFGDNDVQFRRDNISHWETDKND